MQTLKAYLYPIIVEVQIPDSAIAKLRKRTVYAHPIKIYKGIDNPIQILVRNQDNKPINLTGYTMEVDVRDIEEENSVLSYSMTYTNREKGEGYIVLSEEDLSTLEKRRYKLAVKRVNDDDGTEIPAYTDANYGLLLDLEVLPGFN